jgi:DNA repair protein RadC
VYLLPKHFRYRPDLDRRSLHCRAVEEYPTQNGPAKAALIAAALEFPRRRIRPEDLRISFPPDVLPLIRHFAHRRQEHFIIVFNQKGYYGFLEKGLI